jgi:hypothetical protein
MTIRTNLMADGTFAFEDEHLHIQARSVGTASSKSLFESAEIKALGGFSVLS